ncbi:MAG: Sec-independent protein translocase protein TatB [Candidatus Competibacteraceae bacterium]
MFEIGFWELALIGVVAMIVVGPERLPGLARTAGLWLGKARRMLADVKAEVDRELQLEELKHAAPARRFERYQRPGEPSPVVAPGNPGRTRRRSGTAAGLATGYRTGSATTGLDAAHRSPGIAHRLHGTNTRAVTKTGPDPGAIAKPTPQPVDPPTGPAPPPNPPAAN